MIKLKLMNSDEFKEYITIVIENYAKEKALAGNWNEEESLTKSREEVAALLPKDEKSENNYLYSILHGKETIGMIWLAQKSTGEGFIYDIRIMEIYQGQGYGKKTMKQLEIEAKKLGMKKIGLHVFGHNKVARALYEKLGYLTTNVVMSKEI